MGDLSTIERLDRGDGIALAVRRCAGTGPTIVFLPGYGSDMTGGKATALDEWAAGARRACVRFDWSGCGASAGAFEAQTLARWRDDALAVIDTIDGDVILVGSSMGGWVMLLAALARPERMRALVGVAAAPDFSDWDYDDADKRAIRDEGRLARPRPMAIRR